MLEVLLLELGDALLVEDAAQLLVELLVVDVLEPVLGGQVAEHLLQALDALLPLVLRR